MQNLFIPKKLRVGFQERHDTYTGKLSYIIYYDLDGNIKREKSWSGWCDSRLGSLEIDNIPQRGFIINKDVQRYGHFGSGRSIVRIYDPRDFEFEISVDNLMGILMHSDVSKRDIVEQCVFAWYGSELVLLPVNSVDYQASLEYTANQSKNIGKKDMMEGYHYLSKKGGEDYLYIGYLDWWEFKHDRSYETNVHTNTGKKHVFWNGHSFETKTLAVFSERVENSLDENYASMKENFFKTIHSQPIKALAIEPKKYKQKEYYNYHFCQLEGDMLYDLEARRYYYSNEETVPLQVRQMRKVTFNESLTIHSMTNIYDAPNRYHYGHNKDMIHPLPAHLKSLEGETKLLKDWYDTLKNQHVGKLLYVLENGEKVAS